MIKYFINYTIFYLMQIIELHIIALFMFYKNVDKCRNNINWILFPIIMFSSIN